jgi:hypothetical protein
MNSAVRLELYELWFDFLNLARHIARTEARITRNVSREEIQKALEVSAADYAEWGDTDVPFNIWWKTHARLFSILNIPDPELDPDNPNDGIPKPSVDALLLFIPLNRSQKELADEVDAIIGEQMKIAEAAGKHTSRFQFTEGTLTRPDSLALKLTVYRDVALEHPTLVGKLLLAKVKEFYSSRGKTTPTPFTDDPKESSLKKLHRYVKEAEKTMINVANGSFPGREEKI